MEKDRKKLYEAFRKRYPKGNAKKQLEFSNEIHEDRIECYLQIFTEE